MSEIGERSGRASPVSLYAPPTHQSYESECTVVRVHIAESIDGTTENESCGSTLGEYIENEDTEIGNQSEDVTWITCREGNESYQADGAHEGSSILTQIRAAEVIPEGIQVIKGRKEGQKQQSSPQNKNIPGTDPRTWDPLLKMSPKLSPKKDAPLSSCPHCRSIETQHRLPPLAALPPTHFYRFRDEESRLPALERLPPTRHYRFDNSADEGTARVYPDPELKFQLGRPPFPCLIPFIVLNMTYLSWLIADLCYSYGPYTRFKAYFTSSTTDLNRGMEIFAGVFLFLTNMAFICTLVFRHRDYAGPSFSSASRSDKKWVARASILGCLPLVMLIIVASIRRNVPMVLPKDKPIDTCQSLGYQTNLRFEVLDHSHVRGNHTGMSNMFSVWDGTHSANMAFDNIYDPEKIQNNNFILSKVEGDIRNISINYFLQSHQYTVNWHTTNETSHSDSEYFGGSWQDIPNFGFPNLSPPLQSKKLDKWQLKAFSGGSYLELFAPGEKKAWFRTLDREYNTRKTFMEACSSGGVEDVETLVSAGVLLIEFAKDVYDTTD
ncbi:hypothetical protein ABW19_dt0207320 [Dactylella cylindrospora]|nr:hypothetical protein ABW19_dt0207320 [Dactylella cylindrospora]